MDLFEQISPLEQEYTPENVKNDMGEYLTGLKSMVEEKQLELKNEEDSDTKEQMKNELEEIETQIAELEDTMEFMQEAGDDIEIEVGE